MLTSSFTTTLKRKLLSGAIFGAVSGAFFYVFFGLLSESGISRSDLDLLAFIALPTAIVAFLVTPGKDKHLEGCSPEKALLAGIGITVLAYFSSYAAMWAPSQVPPTNLINSILWLYSESAMAVFGAIITLPIALPFGMLGGLLYKFLARRTLSVD